MLHQIQENPLEMKERQKLSVKNCNNKKEPKEIPELKNTVLGGKKSLDSFSNRMEMTKASL